MLLLRVRPLTFAFCISAALWSLALTVASHQAFPALDCGDCLALWASLTLVACIFHVVADEPAVLWRTLCLAFASGAGAFGRLHGVIAWAVLLGLGLSFFRLLEHATL